MEKQTEIWASAKYEYKQKSLPGAGQLMRLPVYPWRKKMHTSPCPRQHLIILYKNKLWNSRPDTLSECWTSFCSRYSPVTGYNSLEELKLPTRSRKILQISFSTTKQISQRLIFTQLGIMKIDYSTKLSIGKRKKGRKDNRKKERNKRGRKERNKINKFSLLQAITFLHPFTMQIREIRYVDSPTPHCTKNI